jgi:hypothetical protein
MPKERNLECDLKTEVDFVPHGADFEMQHKNDFSCRTGRTLRCDLKIEVDFSCRTKRTLICDFGSRL